MKFSVSHPSPHQSESSLTSYSQDRKLFVDGQDDTSAKSQNQEYLIPVLKINDHPTKIIFAEKATVDLTVKTPLEKKYKIAASTSIYDSYARCREIDSECKKRLEEDRMLFKILPSRSADIDQEILEECQEIFDRDLSNFVKKAKELISKNLKINSNVEKEIILLTQRYDMTEKQASYLYHDMGLEFLDSGQDDRALDCFHHSIELYKGSENYETYETYMSIYEIYLKSGKRRKALEILKTTKKKFVSFMSEEQITYHDKIVNELEKKKFIFF